jgi:uncharacterized membrane protein HdeD (DUF308 family)
MELSLFLAKLIGLYFLAVALIALVRREQFLSAMKSMLSSTGLIAFSGFISLIAGIAILIGHPIWEVSWRGLITLIGVLAVIQGFARAGFTSLVQSKLSKFENAYWYIVVVLIILGGYLTYSGFIN